MNEKTIWSEGYKPMAADFKGLHPYTYETSNGLMIKCHLDSTPEQMVIAMREVLRRGDLQRAAA